MVVAQGRYWRVTLSKKQGLIVVALLRERVPEELQDLKDLRIDVPLARWNAVVKHAESDRKLLGGILLDYASPKEPLTRVIGSDRLLVELQRMVRDATVALIESGALVLASPGAEEA